MGEHLLTLLTFLPLAGALLLLVFPKQELGQIRIVALIVSCADFFLSIPLVTRYTATKAGMQFEEQHAWVPQLGITYHLGVDGIAVVLIVLTTFLAPLVILSTFGSITHRVKELMISLLVLQTAMVGTFAALDMILFYVFWELMLVPMYLLIGVWGSERRIYAAVKFFIYTAVGSLLMLVAIIYLYWQTKNVPGGPSFSYADFLSLKLTTTQQAWLFAAFALAFAIKVPLFPLHTWLPDAHVQAPAAGSVVLAGVLLKMGTFGFVRYAMPLFPMATEQFAPLIGWLGVIGIVYGSMMSMAQSDMKKLIAYSSVAHLGFVMMGLMSRTAESTSGAVLQMINHGISTGALFLLIGYMYDRRHTRDIALYGGQAKATPLMAAIFLVVTLSSIGLPATNGFVGEFLILIGTYASSVEWGRVWGILGASGVILGAVYMLTLYQKTYLGPIRNKDVSGTKDLQFHELATLVPLVAAIVVLGVFPQPVLDIIKQPVTDFVVRTTPNSTSGTGFRSLPTPRQIQQAPGLRPNAPGNFMQRPQPFVMPRSNPAGTP
jgi:NADH-quinone oxidoreductase subunit M